MHTVATKKSFFYIKFKNCPDQYNYMIEFLRVILNNNSYSLHVIAKKVTECSFLGSSAGGSDITIHHHSHKCSRDKCKKALSFYKKRCYNIVNVVTFIYFRILHNSVDAKLYY